MGDVIGDLNRQYDQSQEPNATGIRIKADAPLSEMFGYIGHLRTMTSDQWSVLNGILTLFRYKNVAEAVIKEVKERRSEKEINDIDTKTIIHFPKILIYLRAFFMWRPREKIKEKLKCLLSSSLAFKNSYYRNI